MSKKSQHSQSAKHSNNISRSKKLTQKTLQESFQRSQHENDEYFEENVNKVVRYIVYRAGSNLPIKKIDIQRSVLPNIGRIYESVLKKGIEILKEVYGYNLYLCEQPVSSKQYIVENTLSSVDMSITDKEVPDDAKKILILLVLTHIFMSNNKVGEDSLFRFLQTLKIDPYERHTIFGNVKEFVTSAMVRQKYLAIETDQHTRRNSYLWGEKAEVGISKHKILEFVCKIYGDRQPRSWQRQFELAKKQNLGNNEIIENGTTNTNNIDNEQMDISSSEDSESH